MISIVVPVQQNITHVGSFSEGQREVETEGLHCGLALGPVCCIFAPRRTNTFSQSEPAYFQQAGCGHVACRNESARKTPLSLLFPFERARR